MKEKEGWLMIRFSSSSTNNPSLGREPLMLHLSPGFLFKIIMLITGWQINGGSWNRKKDQPPLRSFLQPPAVLSLSLVWLTAGGKNDHDSTLLLQNLVSSHSLSCHGRFWRCILLSPLEHSSFFSSFDSWVLQWQGLSIPSLIAVRQRRRSLESKGNPAAVTYLFFPLHGCWYRNTLIYLVQRTTGWERR